MINKIAVCRKLEALVNYYQELQQLASGLSLQDYNEHLIIKRAIEREIQLIVECATDINNMILRRLDKGPAKDYFNSFIELAENDVIPMDFALKIAPSTGLRNILVHQYQKIDDVTVYYSIRNMLTCYREYTKLIANYLECS